MQNYQKYVNALFLAAAGIVWFLARHFTEIGIGYFQLGRKIGLSADYIFHGLPLLLGALTFVILRANQTSLNFTTDAVSELFKVSWPTKKDVRLGTIVVIFTVVIAGIVLGLIDLGFTSLVKTLIGSTL